MIDGGSQMKKIRITGAATVLWGVWNFGNCAFHEFLGARNRGNPRTKVSSAPTVE